MKLLSIIVAGTFAALASAAATPLEQRACVAKGDSCDPMHNDCCSGMKCTMAGGGGTSTWCE